MSQELSGPWYRDVCSLYWASQVALSSVQFSRSVVCDSLWPHESQHARPPCPSPTLGVHSNLCPLSRWCHPTISPSVVPFSSCLQSFPASGSFPRSQFFTSSKSSLGQMPPSLWASVQFSYSRSVVSNSLRPHGLQHTRPPCPSPTLGACSDSCPSSRWCHPTISPSAVPFSSCLQSFPVSGSFPRSQFFTSGDQSSVWIPNS